MGCMIKVILLFLALVLLIGGYSFSVFSPHKISSLIILKQKSNQPTSVSTIVLQDANPLAIETLRQKAYPGSDIAMEQTLTPGSNYNRFIVSFRSEGLKIYGLLTIPQGQKPPGGWPVILFNHGYIPPAAYSTISSYSIMIDPIATAGYIVFKPDYRGNGSSEGIPMQPYVSPDYIIDSMNALSSIKKYKDVNPSKIGVFGHSMGGNITLHELVLTHDIKAAELMAGVVGDEISLAQWWYHRFADHIISGNDLDTYYHFEQMIKVYGRPDANPAYWDAIDSTKFIDFVSAPVQIQVGEADEDVPPVFSSVLKDILQKSDKTVVYHSYLGADHNLSPYTSSAMKETVNFFNQYLK